MDVIEKKRWIMDALSRYRRWIAEGRKRYGWGPEGQLFFCGEISELGDGRFRAHIQLHDSPEGDVWWHPTFRPLNGATDVEILEEGTSRS